MCRYADRFEAGGEATDVAPQARATLVSFGAGEDSQRGLRGAGERGRERGGEDQRSRAIQEKVTDGAACGNERAGDTEGLRQGGHAHVCGDAQLGGEAGPSRTDDAGRVGFVDDQEGTGGCAERCQLAQGRAVAVHREHRVGDDDLASRRGAERMRDGPQVCVRKDFDASAGEPAAVDDRGVVQRVGENQVFGSGDGRQQAAVRGIAAAEEQRCVAVREARQLRFQLLRRKEIAANEAARAGAGAPGARPACKRLGDARVGCEAQVIVGAEVDQALAGPKLDLRPGRRPKRLEGAQQPAPAQNLQLLFGKLVGAGHRPGTLEMADSHVKRWRNETAGNISA